MRTRTNFASNTHIQGQSKWKILFLFHYFLFCVSVCPSIVTYVAGKFPSRQQHKGQTCSVPFTPPSQLVQTHQNVFTLKATLVCGLLLYCVEKSKKSVCRTITKQKKKRNYIISLIFVLTKSMPNFKCLLNDCYNRQQEMSKFIQEPIKCVSWK